MSVGDYPIMQTGCGCNDCECNKLDLSGAYVVEGKIKARDTDIVTTLKNRIAAKGLSWNASDNIADVFESEHEREMLIEEVADRFKGVLDALLIDQVNDPNSAGTARRLAKMYVREIMSGRYYPAPDVTAFPNEGKNAYKGMLVVRAEIKSMCSHHHQPVTGVCYIGVLPSDKVIGLSKYARIAQWCARRGTLQEELANEIAHQIMKATDSESVGVYIATTHGCMENRGVMAHSSLTQTTVLHGEFHDPSVKAEFFDNIHLQEKRG